MPRIIRTLRRGVGGRGIGGLGFYYNFNTCNNKAYLRKYSPLPPPTPAPPYSPKGPYDERPLWARSSGSDFFFSSPIPWLLKLGFLGFRGLGCKASVIVMIMPPMFTSFLAMVAFSTSCHDLLVITFGIVIMVVV